MRRRNRSAFGVCCQLGRWIFLPFFPSSSKTMDFHKKANMGSWIHDERKFKMTDCRSQINTESSLQFSPQPGSKRSSLSRIQHICGKLFVIRPVWLSLNLFLLWSVRLFQICNQRAVEQKKKIKTKTNTLFPHCSFYVHRSTETPVIADVFRKPLLPSLSKNVNFCSRFYATSLKIN